MVYLSACGSQPMPSSDFKSPKHVKEPIGVWYTVVAGDTLETISNRYNVVFEDLIELNGITDPNQLKVGQPLSVWH